MLVHGHPDRAQGEGGVGAHGPLDPVRADRRHLQEEGKGREGGREVMVEHKALDLTCSI